MAALDPRQALLEYLLTPWNLHVDGVEVHDPLDAIDRTSVQFGRSLAVSGRRLHVVDYADLHGQAWQCVFFLRQDDAGSWHVAIGSTIRSNRWRIAVEHTSPIAAR